MFLITGCGRSGTKHTSEVLAQLGCDAGHERLGRDGEVGWIGLSKLLIRKQHSFDVILHQVRHPIHTISSLRTHSDKLLDYVARFFPTHSGIDTADGRLHRCMEYWYHWNRLAESRASWTFRIEDLDQHFPEFLHRLSLANTPIPTVPKNLNTRKTKLFSRYQRERVTWKKLESIDSGLAENIKMLALKYGYSESDLMNDNSPNPPKVVKKPINRAHNGPRTIYVDQFLLDLPQVRSITRSICDESDFFPSTSETPQEDSWTLSWGYPITKRRFAVAETGFFWDAMHIDTMGLYQFSSLNSSIGKSAIEDFFPPQDARELILNAPLPHSKYRQPGNDIDWRGVVFACQNPADRSIHSVASSEDWWRFLESCCKYYGPKLYVKLHPWNNGEIEARIRQVAKDWGCTCGRAGHSVLKNCDHVVLFNSTFSIDAMLRGVPVKQGAPGYFSQTGAVTYCAGDATAPLNDTAIYATKLLNFLVWKYCFSMDQTIEDWKRLLRHFAYAKEVFPITLDLSYGSYLRRLSASPVPLKA